MKEKIGIFIGSLAILCGIGFGLHYMENYEGIYYAKIDNSKIKALDTTSDMKYEYTLETYNEKGTKKEQKFKTKRELKEDRYIKLTVRFMGVHSWEEVEYEEIPEPAREKIK